MVTNHMLKCSDRFVCATLMKLRKRFEHVEKVLGEYLKIGVTIAFKCFFAVLVMISSSIKVSTIKSICLGLSTQCNQSSAYNFITDR